MVGCRAFFGCVGSDAASGASDGSTSILTFALFRFSEYCCARFMEADSFLSLLSDVDLIAEIDCSAMLPWEVRDDSM